MGQLTIDLPDAVERSLKRNARRAKKSVSEYIAGLEKNEAPRRLDKNGHPRALWEFFGSMPDEKTARAPPEVVGPAAAPSPRKRPARRTTRRR